MLARETRASPQSHVPQSSAHHRRPQHAASQPVPRARANEYMPRDSFDRPRAQPYLSPSRHTTPNPIPALTSRTEAALQLMESEIRTRSLFSSTSLATPLVFVNKPAEHGTYIRQTVLIPNSGPYRLKPGVRANADFLQNENRMWEMMGLAHLLPPCDRKNKLKDRIWREIDRCSMERELQWNQQRMSLDMDQVVVNNGGCY